jgi:UBX domain-containing protein 1
MEEEALTINENGSQFKAFQGTGQTLSRYSFSRSIFNDIYCSPSLEDFPPLISVSQSETEQKVPSFELKIDNSKPVTSIQIRLHNGDKVVGQFNHTHTVQDIRMYIDKYVHLRIAF